MIRCIKSVTSLAPTSMVRAPHLRKRHKQGVGLGVPVVPHLALPLKGVQRWGLAAGEALHHLECSGGRRGVRPLWVLCLQVQQQLRLVSTWHWAQQLPTRPSATRKQCLGGKSTRPCLRSATHLPEPAATNARKLWRTLQACSPFPGHPARTCRWHTPAAIRARRPRAAWLADPCTATSSSASTRPAWGTRGRAGYNMSDLVWKKVECVGGWLTLKAT